MFYCVSFGGIFIGCFCYTWMVGKGNIYAPFLYICPTIFRASRVMTQDALRLPNQSWDTLISPISWLRVAPRSHLWDWEGQSCWFSMILHTVATVGNCRHANNIYRLTPCREGANFSHPPASSSITSLSNKHVAIAPKNTNCCSVFINYRTIWSSEEKFFAVMHRNMFTHWSQGQIFSLSLNAC